MVNQSIFSTPLAEEFEAELKDVRNGVKHLPGSFFTTPEIHQLEMRAMLASEWICIGAPHIGLKPQSAKPFRFLGQPLLLTMDVNGALRLFHNVCRHRGAELVREEQACKAVVCPYHSWRYGLDGACLQTPHAGGQGVHHDDTLNPEKLGLYPVRFEEWAGLLFMTMDTAKPAFTEAISPLLSRWNNADFSSLQIDTALCATAEMTANWKLAAENFVESYHVPAIHKALQRINPMANHAQILGGDLFVGQYGDGLSPDYKAKAWTAEPIAGLGLSDKEYDAIFLYPNTIITMHNDHAFSIVIEPVSANHTREHIHVHFAGKNALHADSRSTREEFQRFLLEVNAEDIEIVESMHRCRQSPGFDGGQFTTAHEQTSAQLQKIYANAMLKALGVSLDGAPALPIADIQLQHG